MPYVRSKEKSIRESKAPGLFTAAIFAFSLFAAAACAQTYSDLYNFGDASGDPLNPQYSGIVAQGRDGNLYSTTPAGETRVGTVFKITGQGAVTVLYKFDTTHGKAPFGGLTLGSLVQTPALRQLSL